MCARTVTEYIPVAVEWVTLKLVADEIYQSVRADEAHNATDKQNAPVFWGIGHSLANQLRQLAMPRPQIWGCDTPSVRPVRVITQVPRRAGTSRAAVFLPAVRFPGKQFSAIWTNP